MSNKLLLAICLYGFWASMPGASRAQESAVAAAAPVVNQAAAKAATDYTIPEIQLAARDGNLGKVRSLIAAGSDVDARNRGGRTALMSAVYFRNKSIVRELLGVGADVNVQDAAGRTALMMAVTAGTMDIVELLLAAGADVTVADKQEQTALLLAEKSALSKARKKELTKLLETAAE